MLNILFHFYTLVFKTKQRTHICFLFYSLKSWRIHNVISPSKEEKEKDV